MTAVLTLPEAEALAERTLAAIDAAETAGTDDPLRLADDREQVASDLAGLRECFGSIGPDIGPDGLRRGHAPHARRYSDGLHRTASLYGVEP